MRLTLVLNSPPRFHFWNDFGAGKKRRIPYYKHWWNIWRREIARKKVADHTLSLDKLPAGSRLMDAEDFMTGPIDALPEELLKLKGEKIVYDHPWPFNVTLDPIKGQTQMYCYTIDSRFFVPREDALVLTNTVMETDQMEANPPFEPTNKHLDIIRRQYDWSTRDDSALIKLPRSRVFPKLNINPMRELGITKERKETSVLTSFDDFTQALIAQHHHQQNNTERLDEILSRRSIAFPHCQVPFNRENRLLNLQLCIDQLLIGKSPLPQIEANPESTRDKEIPDIKPRTWRSLIEKHSQYEANWTFSLPRNSHPHTIQLTSRIKRTHRFPDDMLARSIVHAFGLTAQFARLKAYEKNFVTKSDESNLASVVLQDPLSVAAEHHDKDILERPIVLQTIGFELPLGNFHFIRYQLNTTNFDDTNKNRVKNQVWYSGPITDLGEALRYYLDFQAFDSLSSVIGLQGDNQQSLVQNKCR